jgi:hypothetical protein
MKSMNAGLPGYRSERLSASEARLTYAIGSFEEPLCERWYSGEPGSSPRVR